MWCMMCWWKIIWLFSVCLLFTCHLGGETGFRIYLIFKGSLNYIWVIKFVEINTHPSIPILKKEMTTILWAITNRHLKIMIKLSRKNPRIIIPTTTEPEPMRSSTEFKKPKTILIRLLSLILKTRMPTTTEVWPIGNWVAWMKLILITTNPFSWTLISLRPS